MSNEARRGLMLVLSSPSGAGKSSLAKRLLETDTNFVLSVSATTRDPRPSERDGREYHFMTREQFEEANSRGEFLESALVFSNYYGTPRKPVEQALAAGRDVLFDVDWQGARALRAAAPQDVVAVFVLPPSVAELERRLHTRAQDSEEVIQKRMSKSAAEIGHWVEYEYVLINSEFEETQKRLERIIAAERLKRMRQPWLDATVEALLEECRQLSAKS
ncbi:MAG: guanylate kinase [Caulobacterales bacterium]